MHAIFDTAATVIAVGVVATAFLGCILFTCAAVWDWWELRKIRLETARDIEALREAGDLQWEREEDEIDACMDVLHALEADIQGVADPNEKERILDAAEDIQSHVKDLLALRLERDLSDWMAVVPTVEPVRTLPEHLRGI